MLAFASKNVYDINKEEYTMANTTRIKDLSAVTSVADSDVLPVDGANGS